MMIPNFFTDNKNIEEIDVIEWSVIYFNGKFIQEYNKFKNNKWIIKDKWILV